MIRIAEHEVGKGKEGLAEIRLYGGGEKRVHEGRMSASETKMCVVVDASIAIVRSSLMVNQ